MQFRSSETERDADYAALVVGMVIVWGVCDGVSTLLAASVVGMEFETNPIIRALLPTPPLALGVKLAAAALAGAVALAGERFVRTVPGWRCFFLVLIGLGLAVTGLNLLVAFAVV
ncbi:hypothetical protein [Halococcus saccharolyticus]|uniref:DUF5658 domain-containing protein n=1 Tax=Halococcus saccharolyticus DSM 5350 TaxID=1227455 RepID=M0MD83_9EURY|nr:hypothetical protein [Halococcus saccharolyticus]EMA43696.1 hypothetical protein C449_12792 [Halococcus saccharolyticus DSM 5350]